MIPHVRKRKNNRRKKQRRLRRLRRIMDALGAPDRGRCGPGELEPGAIHLLKTLRKQTP